MFVRYDLYKLDATVRDFYRLTRINLSMVDADFHTLVGDTSLHSGFCRLIQSTEEGKRRCAASDGEMLCHCRECGHAVTHQCHAGLSDMAVPLLEGDTPVGYFLFGQISEMQGERLPFSAVYERVRDLGLDREALEKEYESLYFFDRERIESATRIVAMLTRYIWVEDMILSEADSRFEKLVEYVNTHLQEPLTVAELCRTFNISKNLLYAGFREKYQCTVNQYLINRRMAQARQLLRSTPWPVARVGEAVGVGDTNYFCRLFKKEVGESPLQYRKRRRGEVSHAES